MTRADFDRLESLVGWAKARSSRAVPTALRPWWARFALPTLRRFHMTGIRSRLAQPNSSSAPSICSVSNRNCSQSAIRQSRKYKHLHCGLGKVRSRSASDAIEAQASSKAPGNEVAREFVLRRFENLGSRSGLNHSAVGHHQRVVADAPSLAEIVSDNDDRVVVA